MCVCARVCVCVLGGGLAGQQGTPHIPPADARLHERMVAAAKCKVVANATSGKRKAGVNAWLQPAACYTKITEAANTRSNERGGCSRARRLPSCEPPAAPRAETASPHRPAQSRAQGPRPHPQAHPHLQLAQPAVLSPLRPAGQLTQRGWGTPAALDTHSQPHLSPHPHLHPRRRRPWGGQPLARCPRTPCPRHRHRRFQTPSCTPRGGQARSRTRLPQTPAPPRR
jgi:hypothetical protein